MILAAGLSPAWQQIMAFDRLSLGEVNRARRVDWCASGKVLNVGLALTRMGARARTLSLIGQGAGSMALRELAAAGVQGCWIRSHSPMRVCTTIIEDRPAGSGSRCITELVENAAAATDEELAEFATAFRHEAATASYIVLTGSLPAGAPASYFAELLAMAACPAILDIRGRELEHALPHRPLLVKPNREELAATVGHSLHTDERLLAAMQSLRSRGAGWVLISQGSGTLWALGPEGLLSYRPPELEVVNAIGCGDCLTAGIAAALDRGWEMPEAIRAGMAAAAQNASQWLPAAVAWDDVERWLPQIPPPQRCS